MKAQLASFASFEFPDAEHFRAVKIVELAAAALSTNARIRFETAYPRLSYKQVDWKNPRYSLPANSRVFESSIPWSSVADSRTSIPKPSYSTSSK